MDAIATLVLRLFDGNANDGDGTFLLADPPGRFPKNHARFMSLMEDPSRIPGFAGGDGRRSIVSVTSSIEECLNLEQKAMAVKLSNYDIVCEK